MSMHKIPLTEIEESGLRAHGLDIGTPSQLSDAFRQGVAWAQKSSSAQQPKLGLAEGDRPGYDALWLWFGMSRSSYAVLPRVMMHEMPDAWQGDFARLMDQWDETWVNQPNIGTRVRVVDEGGQLIKTPNWMLNYRHPDREQLNSMRKKP